MTSGSKRLCKTISIALGCGENQRLRKFFARNPVVQQPLFVGEIVGLVDTLLNASMTINDGT
jgi:hypothetical protein